MSKYLRDLLKAEEPLFTHSLRQLEQAGGLPGVDNRLALEIEYKAKAAMRSLGLDPNDTTGQELYYAQLDRVQQQNEHLAASIGTSERANIKEIVPKLVKASKEIKVSRRCWALKKSVAKNILEQMPPEKMMKHLGYKSFASMIKNERFSEIYAALRFSEGPEWLNKYNELMKQVMPSDFESREIEYIQLDHDKWVDLTAEFVHKKKHNLTHSKELGVVIILPMPMEYMRGLPLKTMSLILHYTYEIRLYSAFFKLQQVKPNFGEILVNTLIADPATNVSFAGQDIKWRVIQRYFGKLNLEDYPEAFQPHVQPEDLHWRKTLDALMDLSPELKLWQDMDYVATLASDGEPVSFNIADFAFSYSNGDEFNTRNFYHMRESLWNEIFTRYMGQPVIERQILDQLDNDLINPMELTPDHSQAPC